MNTSTLLVLAVTIPMTIGVLLPQFSKIFAPYLLIWLGALLFLNLIQLETSELLSTFARTKHIVLLSLIKLVVLPLALYASTSVIYPPMALPILLLSGISTGLSQVSYPMSLCHLPNVLSRYSDTAVFCSSM
jgi:bile acid:Na+ symporter, BASS family